MLAFIATHQFLLIGLIFMVVLGPAVGNYACSVVYRLPLGKTPFERHPFCGHCNAALQPKDLFPILSWLSTKGKCRYCHGPIPAIYTVIELACLMLFVVDFLRFGMGELFLLNAAFGVFVIILAAIEWQQGWLSSSMYVYAAFLAALARTLQDGHIYGFVRGFVVALVFAALIARAEAAVRRQPFQPFAIAWIWWAALIGLAVPISPLFVLLLAPVGFMRTRLGIPCMAALAILLPLVVG